MTDMAYSVFVCVFFMLFSFFYLLEAMLHACLSFADYRISVVVSRHRVLTVVVVDMPLFCLRRFHCSALFFAVLVGKCYRLETMICIFVSPLPSCFLLSCIITKRHCLVHCLDIALIGSLELNDCGLRLESFRCKNDRIAR